MGFLWGFAVGRPQIYGGQALLKQVTLGHFRQRRSSRQVKQQQDGARHKRRRQWKATELAVHHFNLTRHCAFADALTVRTGPHTGSYTAPYVAHERDRQRCSKRVGERVNE